MQRPIWKGHISFGLVSIPVTLFSAEKRTDLHFHMLDSRNNARIHYERINDETGREVPWDAVVKAYEFEKDNYVVMKEEEFKKAAPEATKTIETEDFVNFSDINPLYFDKPYFLVPDKFGEKGYVLLREALKKTKKVGIAKVVIRTKEYLAAIVPLDHALILHLLRFNQELSAAEEFSIPTKNLKDYKINTREINMAEQLIDSMTSKWEPTRYHDDYRETLLTWIESKAKHHTPKGKYVKNKVVEDKVIDFMTLLKKSVADKKSSTTKKAKSKAS